MANKEIELATESIPGCVLQLYVWLTNPEQAGSFALASIGISAMTTGYTSAMIAFDFDIDTNRRKNQPLMYGYIPDDNGARGRCFVLMTFMSTLHNLSRSVGCALLAVSQDKRIVLYFIVGEMILYLLFKVARNDFLCYFRIDSTANAYALSFLSRIMVKIITDYTGCLHMRHPVSERAIQKRSEVSEMEIRERSVRVFSSV